VGPIAVIDKVVNRITFGPPFLYIASILRRIFGFKRKEVAGDWRKLHNEEFLKLQSNQEVRD